MWSCTEGAPNSSITPSSATSAYEVMELSADAVLTITAYSPEPDSPSQDGLALLASWAATLDQNDPYETAHPVDRLDP